MPAPPRAVFRLTVGAWELALRRRAPVTAEPAPDLPAGNPRPPPTPRAIQAPIEGRVDALLVRAGDVVQLGEVVAVIDGAEIETRLAGRVQACVVMPGEWVPYGHPLLTVASDPPAPPRPFTPHPATPAQPSRRDSAEGAPPCPKFA
jgi:acetyl/propionyl-CoA carboxylase alpha subunit